MNDPVGIHARLENIYLKYIESALPLRYPSLSDERRALLARPGVITQQPLIEPVTVYDSSGLDLAQATANLPAAYQGLQELARPLFPPGRELYAHQWQALQAALSGKDVIVTTGTGSGKTESFLLPLLAYLAAESRGWAPPQPRPNGRTWWRSGNERVGQWSHSQRPHALRAIILYPLNALVEDQMRRLRSILNDPGVTAWLDSDRAGNRVTFGRYTSLTPLAGPVSSQRVRRLREHLVKADAIERAVLAAGIDESRYHFAQLDGGEIWSRWDAQETPPDILITNYSMLNIMLMRSIEERMFEKTRQWLQEDPSHRFHLVVDELHSYRGTPGTEVSYILRLLLDRLGLEPDSEQLRILGTSASLDDGSMGFLSEFFARPAASFIVVGSPPVRKSSQGRLSSHLEAFKSFGSASSMDPLVAGATFVPEAARRELAQELVPEDGDQPAGAGPSLLEALVASGVPDAVRAACIDDEGILRPTGVDVLSERLFGGVAPEATRGVLLALASAVETDGTVPQPLRSHHFVQNVQNMWACTRPTCVDRDDPIAPQIGPLFEQHRLACDCGARVLDLIVCEICGEVFLGGQRKRADQREVVSSDRTDLEGIPDQFETRAYGRYTVLWPVADHAEQEPERATYTWRKVQRSWQRRYLHRTTGVILNPAQGAADPDMQPVWQYVISGNDVETEPAFPSVCPHCDTDYGRRDVLPSPLRHHRTGFQKTAQVIAGTLMREVEGAARKLVVFSDSRQDAAKLAAGMERDHFRDMVRVTLLEALRDTSLDLEAAVRLAVGEIAGRGLAREALIAKLADLNPALASASEKEIEPDDAARSRVFQTRYPAAANLVPFLFGMTLPTGVEQDLRELLMRYPSQVPLGQLRSQVFWRLVGLGICPGGNSLDTLEFREGVKKRHWHEAFRWTDEGPFERDQVEAHKHVQRLHARLMVELMSVLFTHQVRTLESVGHGYVHAPVSATADLHRQAVDVVVRYLSVKRRYADSGFVYPGEKTEFPIKVRKYLEKLEIAVDDATQLLERANAIEPSATGAIVRGDNLVVVEAAPSAAVYRCRRCHARFLHAAGGLCVYCGGNVVLIEGNSDSTDPDYYSYLASSAGPAFRLNTEELTGQTDAEDRASRQRRFQEIFLSDENGLAQGIDLLSVTTTMEAGVDIGSLQGVMLSNMPPRRFNYQQRVGRAGRRGAGLSVAVTLCRDRSHDAYYFNAPEAITGDPPPTPYVDTSSLPIFERVLNKEVLRRVFASLREDAADVGGESVHGEFGSVTEWEVARPAVVAFLEDEGRRAEIRRLAVTLASQTALSHGDVDEALSRLRLLPTRIDAVVSDDRLVQEALSERLAYSGLLPMFGFPTRTRVLYLDNPAKIGGHPFPPKNLVDRDLDLAISTFAPGSEVVRDKRVHRSVGVIRLKPSPKGLAAVGPGLYPSLEVPNPRPLGVCSNCHAVHEANDLADLVGHTDATCPTCSSRSLRVLDAREPRDFYSDGRPEDYSGFFELQTRSTRPSLAVSEPGEAAFVGNALVEGSAKQILTFNDYYGRGGFLFRPDPHLPDGAYDTLDGGQGRGLSSRRVALLARRRTDTMQVGVRRWPEHHAASPETVEGRAAWYSLAFAMRIAAGVLLDIEPTELESGLYVAPGESGAEARAFMADRLENGAGYASLLSRPDWFGKMLDAFREQSARAWAEHAPRCDSSCARCLRDYSNLAYHPILDWRLAVDMMDLLRDANTRFVLRGSHWSELFTGSRSALRNSLDQLDYEFEGESFGLPSFVHSADGRAKVVILRHPLWTADHPEVVATQKRAASQLGPSASCVSLSPFMLLRRPSEAL